MITDAAYTGLTALARPFVARYFAARGEGARLALPDGAVGVRPLWFHACSLGEVNTALPILAAARERWPHIPRLLTTSTRTGHDHAAPRLHDTALAWLPFDHPPLVRAFLGRVAPRALALIETELWPGLIRECERAEVPVVLVNGRLSTKHFARYRAARAIFRPAIRRLTLAAMQDDAYRARIVALGADPSRVIVTGNAKFDGARTGLTPDERASLWRQLQLPDTARLLVFGSTREGGDEALAQRCWERLAQRPEWHLVIAPRHEKRLDEALRPFTEPVMRFSACLRGETRAGQRITVIDVTGHLAKIYGIAAVAVIGGSFYGSVNGHNPIESAALGIPTVFGPNMGNFRDAAEQLVTAQGALQVARPDDLPEALERLIDGDEQHLMARRGRDVVLHSRGAVARTLDALAQHIDVTS